MTTYISLAVSATMFPTEGTIHMHSVDAAQVQQIISQDDVISACNTSHSSTIDAIRCKFGINLPLPVSEKAPKVSLMRGESVLIIQAQLPRLAEGEVHSPETIENAAISFRLWTVA